MFVYEGQIIAQRIIRHLNQKDIDNHYWEIGEQLWCQIFIEGRLKWRIK